MGYASRDEILGALNELLEAERAGARVALASFRLDADAAFGELMHAVRLDELRWCAMLARQIGRLGSAPSGRIGDFRDKALAIADPWERLAFLNRGQGWVVRRLEALLPKIRDDALHHDLKDMLDCHRRNIEQANGLLRQRG